MKVSELIELLKTAEAEATVVIDYGASMISGYTKDHKVEIFELNGKQAIEISGDTGSTR